MFMSLFQKTVQGIKNHFDDNLHTYVGLGFLFGFIGIFTTPALFLPAAFFLAVPPIGAVGGEILNDKLIKINKKRETNKKQKQKQKQELKQVRKIVKNSKNRIEQDLSQEQMETYRKLGEKEKEQYLVEFILKGKPKPMHTQPKRVDSDKNKNKTKKDSSKKSTSNIKEQILKNKAKKYEAIRKDSPFAINMKGQKDANKKQSLKSESNNEKAPSLK